MAAIRLPSWKAVPKFYVDETYRVQWKRLKEGIPKAYKQYWLVYHDGKHIADFFRGRARWYAVIFDHGTIRDTDVKRLCLVVSGLYAHPDN